MTAGRGVVPLAATALAAVAVLLSACGTAPPKPPETPPVDSVPLTPAPTGSNTKEVPDAVPRVEPRSRYGNPPFYEVMGKRYYVLSSSSDYVERGVASWYGPGFHQVRTSAGDIYDMYGMSAAHKTLPLPAYVQVTNLQNGRTCVVRVNDRGPFVGNRIIDLSYSAAAKLDMLRNGTAMVEVRTLDPRASAAAPSVDVPQTTVATGPATTATPPVPGAAAVAPTAAHVAVPAALYIQAGAFADPVNAERLAIKLREGQYGKVFTRDDKIAGRSLYRVRIGPVPNVAEFDRIVAALERAGVHDAHLAMD